MPDLAMPPSSVATLTEDWPAAAPEPIGVLALRGLAAKIDDPAWREQPPGSNQGPVVAWACERWLSAERYARAYAAGKLAWCAGAVCSALLDAGSEAIRDVASLDCDYLWRRLAGYGWIVQEPQPGDLYFLGRPGDLKHVGLVEEVRGEEMITVSGNSNEPGHKTPDRVARHAMPRARVVGFARLPR